MTQASVVMMMMIAVMMLKDKYFALKFLILIIFYFFFHLNANAHHGGESTINGPGLAGPIITTPAFTLPKGTQFFGLGTNYTNFNTFSNTGLLNLGKHGEDIHQFKNIFTPSLSGGYGITDNFYLSFNLPYAFKFNQRVSDGPPINVGSSIGVGDLTLFSAYRFLKREDINLHVAFLGGLKIPSGVRRDRDNQGFLFGADDQPGTGSWDPSIGLAVSKGFKYFSLTSNGLYKFSTQGTQHTTVGDIALFNLAAAHRVQANDRIINKVFPQHLLNRDLYWDLILEGNGQWSEKSRTDIYGTHIVDGNHGGVIIYISPGLRLIVNKKWITNLSVGLPVIEDLNNLQKGPNARLILNFTRVF